MVPPANGRLDTDTLVKVTVEEINTSPLRVTLFHHSSLRTHHHGCLDTLSSCRAVRRLATEIVLPVQTLTLAPLPLLRVAVALNGSIQRYNK
jgi:hypothetical protein